MASIWNWIPVAGDVRVGVATSRRDRTTSTLIVAGRQALLIDPAWDPDELAAIAADLAGRDLVVSGFATHAHHDHLLWHPGLGAGPRWASGTTAGLARSGRDHLLSELGPGWPPALAELVGSVTATPGSRVPWNGPEVVMITHDAHVAGHTALWLPTARVLVAGDMLSDVELPLLETSTPADYRRGLTALETFAMQAAVLIPGHGNIALGAAAAAGRWRTDADYLQDLTSAAGSSDPRLCNPGMRAAHRLNMAAAKEPGN